MTILAAVLLALAAGITEILPVSGTGHLFLLAKLLGVSAGSGEFRAFRGMLYLGVALGLLLFYRVQMSDLVRDLLILLGLRRPTRRQRVEPFGRRLALLLLCAAGPMVPALLLNGLRRTLEDGDAALAFVGAFLCVSGGIFYFSTRGARGKRTIHQLTLPDSLKAGLFQAASVLPGMSRSGLVMSALLLNGADGPAAGEFAGLMGIPVFLAAGLIQLLGAGTGAGESPRTAILLLGLCLSALSAYFTLRVFTEALSHRKPALYAYWSWGAGILALILFLISA